MQTMLVEGSDDFSWPSVHLAVLDGWFDKGQHFSSLLHKCSHLSFFLTLKARRPSLLPSKSDVIVCHTVSPFASTAALLLDHVPQLKRHYGFIWNRAAITYTLCSFAECENASNLFCDCSVHWSESNCANVPSHTPPVCVFSFPFFSFLHNYIEPFLTTEEP